MDRLKTEMDYFQLPSAKPVFAMNQNSLAADLDCAN
jgi:hypothetical protein